MRKEREVGIRVFREGGINVVFFRGVGVFFFIYNRYVRYKIGKNFFVCLL